MTIYEARILLDERKRKVVEWRPVLWEGKDTGILSPPSRFTAEADIVAMGPEGARPPVLAAIDLKATSIDAAYEEHDRAVREFLNQLNGPKILRPDGAPILNLNGGRKGRP